MNGKELEGVSVGRAQGNPFGDTADVLPEQASSEPTSPSDPTEQLTRAFLEADGFDPALAYREALEEVTEELNNP